MGLVYLFHDDNRCLLSMCCADIGGCAYAVYMCMELDVLVILYCIYSIALVF